MLGLDVPGPGPVFVPFPVAVPTPGGNMATGAYYDDRATGDVRFGPLHVPLPSPLGYVGGDSTWVYLETNGAAGLQRGGCTSLPQTPLQYCQGSELQACDGPNHDELIF